MKTILTRISIGRRQTCSLDKSKTTTHLTVCVKYNFVVIPIASVVCVAYTMASRKVRSVQRQMFHKNTHTHTSLIFVACTHIRARAFVETEIKRKIRDCTKNENATKTRRRQPNFIHSSKTAYEQDKFVRKRASPPLVCGEQ